MPNGTARADRVSATREAILAAAERLYAEHGVFAVSNRQISEAAGQGNNAAVNYHFGTKTDLVRAIVRKHHDQTERIRERMVSELGDSTETRDWVTCLVRPPIEHLAELGTPTWYGRFSAQLMTEPSLRDITSEESLTSPTLVRAIDGLNRCIPELPVEVRMERGDMVRQLMVHTVAERERALAEGSPTPRSTWHAAASGLIDAIVGLWHAPVTETRQPKGERRT
ncbi:TetR family transcriptional regulator [Prauserella sp. PE36]|uniref:Helix-turn-helix transcriptional regulator n=1 Tax=Prauserella endophytica TaxID=1592324 RepID=A0ABY2S4I2_9PSEU|nr:MULTISPECIES: TetR/AcrR family transcriptional regulator [Prauserella]PXY33200.1 TetR family transcriptional regulator [Prauserella coralliicola]RBM16248.1 TetR family transcriptional regulator [Prauserella sp. PE36]TKG70778.1 helix-turn-helix transcriptional regulator [Prauserella endophytica]